MCGEVRTLSWDSTAHTRIEPTVSLLCYGQLVEIYNFVRTVLLSKDGVEVVLSCGGKALFDHLQAQTAASEQLSTSSVLSNTGIRSRSQDPLPTSLPSSQGLAPIVGALRGLLESAVTLSLGGSTAAAAAAVPSLPLKGWRREGDDEYDEYVTALLQRERSCLFKTLAKASSLQASASRRTLAGLSVDDRDSIASVDAAAFGQASRDDDADDSEEEGEDSHNGSDDNAYDPMPDEDLEAADDIEEADADADGNDDGSDGDGSDVDDGVLPEFTLDLESLEDDNQETVREELELHDDSAVGFQSVRSSDRAPHSPPKPVVVKGWSTHVEFVQYEDREFYYESPSGTKYPKHPSRSQTGFSDCRDDHVDGEAATAMPYEPCTTPNPVAMNAFVELATVRRAQFLQSDPLSRARLVYDSTSHFETLARASNSSSAPPPSAKPEAYPYHVPEKRSECSGDDDSLTFDSCFESGNLARAVRIGEYEYDLFLRRDFNTTGHMQWFYFAVSNVCARGTSAIQYRFNIVNLCKPDSLFNHGLQPVVYSVRDAREKRIGWRRSGTEIYYFSNPFPRSTKSSTKATASTSDAAVSPQSQTQPVLGTETYFTLTFTLAFPNTDDTYLVAHSYPYTVSDHERHVEQISSRLGHRSSSILRRSVLCRTLSGKECELLTVSDFAASPLEQKARRAVVVSSRVHPGEAQASWMLRGILDFLVSDTAAARVLRRLFVFQIVPMLNPDGVYYGNSRCSLAACDLNRVWHNPSPTCHPTIFHTKELLRTASATRGLVFFCDLHGHSRKKNVFVYGCDTKKRPNPVARAFAKRFATQATAKRFVSLPDCSFKVSKSKETTARVVVAHELKLAWCFTLEASFCGGSFGVLQGMHYNPHHMQQVGASLCETLLPACVTDDSVREKLAALVDDYSVNVAAVVDSTLRESGIVCGARENGTPTPRKVKGSGGNASQRPSEPDSSVTTGARRKASSSTSKPPSLLKQQGSGKTRKQFGALEPGTKGCQEHRQPPSTTVPSAATLESRDATPRTYALASDCSIVDRAALSRAKISGKKLRHKKKTKTKTKKKTPVPNEAPPERSQDTMPIISNGSSLAHSADSPLATPVRGSSSSSSSSATSTSTSSSALSNLPAKPAMCAPAARSPSVRHSAGCCLQLTDSIASLGSKPSAGMLPSASAFSADTVAREPQAILFPPPISDLAARSSPKAKSTGVRFRYDRTVRSVSEPRTVRNVVVGAGNTCSQRWRSPVLGCQSDAAHESERRHGTCSVGRPLAGQRT